MTVWRYLKGFLSRRYKRKSENILEEPKLNVSENEATKLYTWENIPLKNWLILEESIEYLVISGKPTEKQLLNAWLEVFQGYIDQCGISDEYEKILRLSKKLVIARIKLATTGERYHVNAIEDCEDAIKDLTRIKVDKKKGFIHACKFMGYNLKEDEVLATYYYKIIEEMNNYNGKD